VPVTQHKRKRRSRNRRPKSTAPQVPPRAPRSPVTERPDKLQAPWAPFPLIELTVLVGLVIFVTGLVTDKQPLLACGVALAAIGGLDTSLREHFNGYRSHTFILAGIPAVLIAAVLAFAKVMLLVIVPVMVIAFAAAFIGFRRAWDSARAKVPA